MTKNGKIMIFIGVLLFIAALVVCGSVLFTVKRSQIVWYSTTSALSTLSEEDVLQASGVRDNSVFSLDREIAVENIEKKYHFIRILDLEVVYPNLLKVHAVERQKVYAIPTDYGDYLITDEYLKVLDIVPDFTNSNVTPILLNIELANNYEKGDTIEFTRASTFSSIYNAFFALGQDLSHMRAICKEFVYTNSKLTIKTHFDVDIVLDNPTQNTKAKMQLAIKCFDLLGTEEYGAVNLKVFLDENQKLNCVVEDK